MTTFVLTTDANFHDAIFATRTGGDLYTICLQATLTIDGDTRYGPNTTPTTGSPGAIQIYPYYQGNLLIDASNVWLIPYDTGIGNVPAPDTLITQGGVSAKLLGVWSAINVAPTATGAPMPATGFLKVRQKTAGNYVAGALGGVGANATGQEVQGWIEVCGDQTAYVSLCNTGVMRTRGGWFQLGVTSGVRGQTMALPTSGGTNFWVGGVFIETAVGSGVYRPWPCLTEDANGGWQTTNQGADDRSPFVQCDGQQIRIGANAAAASIGKLPIAGLRVMLPNVVLQSNTAGARNVTMKPSPTLTNRYEFSASALGVADLEKCTCLWYANFASGISLVVKDSTFADFVFVTTFSGDVTFDNVAFGCAEPAGTVSGQVLLSILNSTAILRHCSFARAGVIGTSNRVLAFIHANVTAEDCFVAFGCHRTAIYSYGAIYCAQQAVVTLNDCTVINTIYSLGSTLYCTNLTVADRCVGASDAVWPQYHIYATNSLYVTVDGLQHMPGVVGVEAYNGLILAVSSPVVVRNIGNPSAKIDFNGLTLYVLIMADSAPVLISRVYCTNARAANLVYPIATQRNLKYDNLWGDVAQSLSLAGHSMLVRGAYFGGAAPSGLPYTGSHFWDGFNSATTGRVGVVSGVPTVQTAEFVTLSGTAYFAAGNLCLPALGDSCTWEFPYFVLGYTGMSAIDPVVLGGANRYTHIAYDYQINTGSGWSAWKAMTGVNLGAEVGITPDFGVKFRVRATCSVGPIYTENTYITGIYWQGVTDAVSQQIQYPLDPTFHPDSVASQSQLCTTDPLSLSMALASECRQEQSCGSALSLEQTMESSCLQYQRMTNVLYTATAPLPDVPGPLAPIDSIGGACRSTEWHPRVVISRS